MVVTVLAMSPVESIGARLVGALLYAVGFIVVILGKFALFTEYTILAVLPLLSGRTTASRAARLLGIVYAATSSARLASQHGARRSALAWD